MLTGSRPWEGDSAASVALARLSGPIPDPMTVRPSVPPDLAAITRRALALDPRDRWASASVLADALEATLAPGGSAAAAGAAAAVAGGAAAAGPADSQAGAVAAGALVGATVVSATARPNPAGIPYAPDAYASTDTGASGRTAAGAADAADDRRAARGRRAPARWSGAPARSRCCCWPSIAFLVFQAASGGVRHRRAQVTVPNFVGHDVGRREPAGDDASG